MKPVYGEIQHNPDAGLFGDCHRAAIASILELPVSEVPHFFRRGLSPSDPEGEAEIVEFLATHSLVPVTVPWLTDSLNAVLAAADVATSGKLHYLLYGRSESGCGHTVVCFGDRIVHNPTEGDPKLVGPLKPIDGSEPVYWTTFLCLAL